LRRLREGRDARAAARVAVSFARECERLEALFGSIGGCEPVAIDPG